MIIPERDILKGLHMVSGKIFADAIIALYNSLVENGYYPSISMIEEDEFLISWFAQDNSRNTLGYWTDENTGIYRSYLNGIALHEEDLTADDFLNLCYNINKKGYNA